MNIYFFAWPVSCFPSSDIAPSLPSRTTHLPLSVHVLRMYLTSLQPQRGVCDPGLANQSTTCPDYSDWLREDHMTSLEAARFSYGTLVGIIENRQSPFLKGLSCSHRKRVSCLRMDITQGIPWVQVLIITFELPGSSRACSQLSKSAQAAIAKYQRLDSS